MKLIPVLFVMTISLMACSRSQDVLEEDQMPAVLKHVSLGVKEADISDITPETKSEISITNVVSFAWSATDIVGMFPNKGAQAYFEMSDHSGETVAEFDGGGWALKSASEYAVYFPYNYDHRYKNNIPFSYHGQVQHGKNNYSHLADWQFMAQGMQHPEGGACNYSMERIEAIVIFKLVVPDIINCDKLTFRLADGHKVVVSTRLHVCPLKVVDGLYKV